MKPGDKETTKGRAVHSSPSAARATILEDRIVELLERIVPDVCTFNLVVCEHFTYIILF